MLYHYHGRNVVHSGEKCDGGQRPPCLDQERALGGLVADDYALLSPIDGDEVSLRDWFAIKVRCHMATSSLAGCRP